MSGLILVLILLVVIFLLTLFLIEHEKVPFLLLIEGISIFIVWKIISAKKRSKTLKASANSMGLSFHEHSKLPAHVFSAKFHLFQKSDGRIMPGLMYDYVNDINIWLFDYSYDTGVLGGGSPNGSAAGGGGISINQTVALFYSESINLPNFDLRPMSIFRKIRSEFGHQGIDFESHPRFSSIYLLRGEDENAIRRIFTNKVLTFFSDKTDLWIQARENKLIYYRPKKMVASDDIPSFLREAKIIFRLLTGS